MKDRRLRQCSWSFLVMADSGITSQADLARKRVGAIADSTNMALAQRFSDVVTVPFDGATDDVLDDMVSALRRREVDAVVDDDVALVPLGQRQPDLTVAFTVASRNCWGVTIAKGNDTLRRDIDEALRTAIADGSLERQWHKWMPDLAF